MITLRPSAGITPITLDQRQPGECAQYRVGRRDHRTVFERPGCSHRQYSWALKSGLGPNLRIASEAVENKPCRNVIAVGAEHEDDKRVQLFVKAYHSYAVRAGIIDHYQGRQLPAW